MFGVIYFHDGHTEEITDRIEHCTGEIVLETESGIYGYWECTAMYEDPYYNHFCPIFYKWDSEADDWAEINYISHIELYNEE